MIVDSMSREEIFELFRQDLLWLNFHIRETNNSISHKRIMREPRGEDRFYFDPVVVTSKNGFVYTLQYFKRAKNETQRDALGFLYYCRYVQKKQTYAFLYSLGRLPGMQQYHFNFLNPHFIQRYNERFLKDPKLEPSQIIHKYILRNCKRMAKYIPSEKYPECSYLISNDGIALCEVRPNMDIEHKTYISWDMLGPDQKQIALEGKDAALGWQIDLAVPADEWDVALN